MSAQGWSRVARKQRFKGAIDANTISIAAIVTNYGGEVREGRSSSVRCCLHNDSRRSAVINTLDKLYLNRIRSNMRQFKNVVVITSILIKLCA